jgi:hypothetical protein
MASALFFSFFRGNHTTGLQKKQVSRPGHASCMALDRRTQVRPESMHIASDLRAGYTNYYRSNNHGTITEQ